MYYLVTHKLFIRQFGHTLYEAYVYKHYEHTYNAL